MYPAAQPFRTSHKQNHKTHNVRLVRQNTRHHLCPNQNCPHPRTAYHPFQHPEHTIQHHKERYFSRIGRLHHTEKFRLHDIPLP